MTKVRIIVLLGSAIALIFVILALQLLTPGDKIDQAGPGGAHVVYSVDQGMVFAPGACVTVRWQVDQIQKVFFDDQPSVGQGIEQVCADTQTLPVLRVDFQDNTSQDFHLAIRFWVDQPATWLLIGIGVLLGLVSLYIVFSRMTAQNDIRHTPRLMLIFTCIGMLVALISVAALVLEMGLQFYFGHFGTRDEQSAYLRSRAEVNVLNSATMPMPLVEYGLSPDFPGHNRLGYRGDEVQVPKPDGVYRIVTLGDSTTYGAFVAYDQSYPYALQQVLRDDYGYKYVEVVNGGVPGYTTWNMVVDLAFRIAALQPDLVIVYAGSGDVGARGASPECYSGASPFLGLSPSRALRAIPVELSPLALYRLLAINFGWMENPAQESESYFYSPSKCLPEVDAQVAQNTAANPPVYFERNMREMISIAKASGFKIMFMTSAYDLKSPQIPDYWAKGVVDNNAITMRLAQEKGIFFLDYAAIAPTDESRWNDLLHLNPLGNREQAQDIAQYLANQGEFCLSDRCIMTNAT